MAEHIVRCPGCARNIDDEYCFCGPIREDGSIYCADKNTTGFVFAKDVYGNDILPSDQKASGISTVHVEPECVKEGNGCNYQDPHHHGFACDKSCVECEGVCHFSCPQYYFSFKKNPPPMLPIPGGVKMMRESLCLAQWAVLNTNSSISASTSKRLQQLIDACDVHRPLGPDGKHGDRHTPTCGCEDK